MNGPFSPRLRDIAASEFPHLEAHWNATPAERMRERAEIEHHNALSMDMMDRALERVGRWPTDWSDADKAAASRNASRAFDGVGS